MLVLFALVILKTPLKEYTAVYENLATFPLWWIPLSLVLSLILHDTYFYWMHRLLHHEKLYKYIHAVHHKSTNPSPFASHAFHFLEAISEMMIVPIILFLLPMHIYSLLIFGTITFMINVYGHLGYEIMPKGFRNSFLFEIIGTSLYHNLHHSKFKGNYGLYFRVWDRLMKTENPDYVKAYDALQEKRFAYSDDLIREIVD
ncbi:MAG: sterol desaturase family protein [Chitinophagales bacterium]|nr:sterol desaturase family protein [Chitinophagales bacterium]